jgi:hypothetical protein
LVPSWKTQEISRIPSAMPGRSETTAPCEPGRRLSPNTKSAGFLTLGLPELLEKSSIYKSAKSIAAQMNKARNRRKRNKLQ